MRFRGFVPLVVCVVVTVGAFGQPSLPLPAELVGAPFQPVSARADLTLGASGMYTFTFTPSPPKMVQNFLIGSVAGSSPNVAANKPFFYPNGTVIDFHISGILPPSGCS